MFDRIKRLRVTSATRGIEGMDCYYYDLCDPPIYDEDFINYPRRWETFEKQRKRFLTKKGGLPVIYKKIGLSVPTKATSLLSRAR